MEYHIFVDGKHIASFLEEADRDICQATLQDYWGDECKFTTEAEGE